MVTADTLIADRCRGWGVQAWIDVRCPGSPFRFPAYGADMFAKDAFLWADTYVHLGAAGHRVIAGMALRAIAALPAR